MSKKPEQHLKVGEWWYLPQQDKLVKIGDAGEITSTADLDNLCQKAINYFILNAGRLITREELLLDVWGVKDVSDGRISRVIRVLRVALGDDSKEPKYIETIPKRGFRFIAPVIEAVVHNDKAAEPAPAPLPTAVVEELPPLTETPMRVESDPTLITGQRQLVKFTMLFALVSLIALLFFWQFFINKQVDDSPERFIRYKPITSLPGLESYFDVSPDGKNVIFSHQEGFDKKQKLMLLSLKNYEYHELFSGNYDYVGAQYSPDGEFIVYQKRSDLDNVCEIRRFKLNKEYKAHSDEILARCSKHAINSNIDWAPDGKSLIYTDFNPANMMNSLVVLNVKTKNKDTLTLPPSTGIGDVMGRFSPDGKKIVFIRDTLRSAAQLWLLDLSTRSTIFLHQLTKVYPSSISWLDDDNVVFNDTRWSIARFSIKDKKIYPMFKTDEDSMAVSVMPNGNLMSSVGNFRKSKVRKISNPLYSNEEYNNVIFESNRSEISVGINPEIGKPNSLVSRRTGLPQLWYLHSDGTEELITNFERFYVIKQQLFSPDGNSLAIKVDSEIIVISNKNKINKISGDDVVGTIFSWSSDAKFLFYESMSNGNSEIVKVDLESGVREVYSTESIFYRESSDGVYVLTSDRDGKVFTLQHKNNGEIQKFNLPRLFSLNDILLHDGMIYYSYALDKNLNEIAVYDIAKNEYMLTGVTFKNSARGFSISNDSKFLYVGDVEIGDMDLAILEIR